MATGVAGMVDSVTIVADPTVVGAAKDVRVACSQFSDVPRYPT
jgi:hypothetical protein